MRAERQTNDTEPDSESPPTQPTHCTPLIAEHPETSTALGRKNLLVFICICTVCNGMSTTGTGLDKRVNGNRIPNATYTDTHLPD